MWGKLYLLKTSDCIFIYFGSDLKAHFVKLCCIFLVSLMGVGGSVHPSLSVMITYCVILWMWICCFFCLASQTLMLLLLCLLLISTFNDLLSNKNLVSNIFFKYLLLCKLQNDIKHFEVFFVKYIVLKKVKNLGILKHVGCNWDCVLFIWIWFCNFGKS